MPTQIQVRRDAAATWTSVNPTLASGEIGFETDTGKVKVGDGTTAWASLAYLAGEGGGLTDGDYGDVVVSSSGTVLSVERVLQSNGVNSAVSNSTVLASNNGTAGASYSSVISSQGSTADGTLSSVIASNASSTDALYSTVVSGEECTATAEYSSVIGALFSSILGSGPGSAGGNVIMSSFQGEIPDGVFSAALISGDNTSNPVSNSLAMGFDPAFGPAASKDFRTIHLMAENGNAHLAGAIYFGVDTWTTDVPSGGGSLGYAASNIELTNGTGVMRVTTGGNADITGNSVRIRTNSTPATATALGNKGEIRWDADYIYVAVDANTWKRAALTTW